MQSIKTSHWIIAAAVLVGASGCGERGDASVAPEAVVSAASGTSAPQDLDGLVALGAQAVREQRLFSPAGNNAIEHYLAARGQAPTDAAVAAALSELQPYAVIATEQAIARGDLADAQRLLGLTERSDPKAPALPRLRASLLAETAATEAERARAAADAERLAVEEKTQEAAAPTAQGLVSETPPPPVAATPVVARAASPAQSAPAALALPKPAPAAEVPVPQPAGVASVPQLLVETAPRYPQTAMNRKIEGKVDVAFTIQPDGNVSNVRVVNGEPSGIFDKAAIAAVSRYRFEASDRSHVSTRSLSFRLSGTN